MIRPYLSRMIIDHKTQGGWKIKLTMVNKTFSPKDSEETHIMYSPSDNIEVEGFETDKIIKDLF